jgi:ligand-binding sensor domain-containing protein
MLFRIRVTKSTHKEVFRNSLRLGRETHQFIARKGGKEVDVMRTLILLCVVPAFLFSNRNIAQAQWVQTNTGLTDLTVYSFAANGTNLFAGSNNGVFLSTDNGTSWTAVNTGLPASAITSLAISGTNLFAAVYGNGVYLSTDNGTSWTAINSGLTGPHVVAFAVSGTNLFAGVYLGGGGVYLSTNNGTSWTATSSTSNYVQSLALNGTNLFAGTLDGLFFSTDNGTSWTAVNSGLPSYQGYALGVSGTNLFAGGQGGVSLSTNNGTSWTTVNAGLNPNAHFVSSLAVSGTNLFAGTAGSAGSGNGPDGGVFLSTDNGTSWTNTGLSLPTAGVVTLAVSGTNLFAGTADAGVWQRPLSEMIVIPTPRTPFTAYLRGSGSDNNPPTLFLNNNAPTAGTSKYKDSPSVVSQKYFQ